MSWHRGVKVHATWARTDSERNSWVLLSGPSLPTGGQAVWWKLYEGGEASLGYDSMFSIFLSAKERGTLVDLGTLDNAPAGSPVKIYEVYGW